MPWLLATLYDRMMGRIEAAGLAAWRAELLRDLSGRVLEIGAGTGANLPHYPEPVERLVLAEPDPHMHRRLAQAAARDPRVELSSASSEDLPWPDASFDAVVSTLVLCSVRDVPRSLAQIRRVLRPGGAFVFLEHVAADDDPGRLAWQRRLEPLWRWSSGNCHLTRRTGEALSEAGLRIERAECASIRKAIPLIRPSIRGIARRDG